MRSTDWLATLAMAMTVATAMGASEERSSLAACGHYEELAAARRALEAGDKASALIHLRNADALLTQCQRDLERAAEPAGETVVGGAEAPPTPTV